MKQRKLSSERLDYEFHIDVIGKTFRQFVGLFATNLYQ